MSYYDNTMVSNSEKDLQAVQTDGAFQGNAHRGEGGYKPFRRKAALRDLPIHDDPLDLTKDSKVETLPALVPETWELLRHVPLGVRDHFLSRAPLVNYFRDTTTARAFDVLRTRLLQTLKHKGWNRVAVTAPTAGCGATFTATNLALSLARVPDCRMVLMDLNMRDPGVKNVLDVAAAGRQQKFLDGQISARDHLVKCSDTLALGLVDKPSNTAAELLQSPICIEVLETMIEDMQPDVVLYDLPPVLAYDDFTAFMPQVDGVLLVSDGEQTTADQIKACEKIFGGHVPLLGVVLNRGRSSGLEAYAS